MINALAKRQKLISRGEENDIAQKFSKGRECVRNVRRNNRYGQQRARAKIKWNGGT